MDAEHNKRVASVILAPLLGEPEEDEEVPQGKFLEEERGASSISREEEFIAEELLEAIETRDLKSVIRLIRSLRR